MTSALLLLIVDGVNINRLVSLNRSKKTIVLILVSMDGYLALRVVREKSRVAILASGLLILIMSGRLSTVILSIR